MQILISTSQIKYHNRQISFFVQVFYGNQTTCLKINPRQIQKIVNRAADLQERGPEFLDLLSMIVKVAGTDLTLKRNQAYVMKYIMQNFKKVAFVLDLPRDERSVIFLLFFSSFYFYLLPFCSTNSKYLFNCQSVYLSIYPFIYLAISYL